MFFKKKTIFERDVADNANDFNLFSFKFEINGHILKVQFIQDFETSKFTFIIYDVTDLNKTKLFAVSQETYLTIDSARNAAMNYFTKNFEKIDNYFEKLKK